MKMAAATVASRVRMASHQLALDMSTATGARVIPMMITGPATTGGTSLLILSDPMNRTITETIA